MRSKNAALALFLSALVFSPAQAQDGYYSQADEYTQRTAALQPADYLKPGEFEWLAPDTTPGQLIVVISLDEQRAHVYRGSTRIAVSTVSSGKRGMETPTGVYEILQKKKVHHSNLYDDAPMPFMQRLTWDGVALHAGRIPGHPASHGCVRLPKEFARQLFDITDRGSTVVVADDATAQSLLRAGLQPYLALMVGTPSLPAGLAGAEPSDPWPDDVRAARVGASSAYAASDGVAHSTQR